MKVNPDTQLVLTIHQLDLSGLVVSACHVRAKAMHVSDPEFWEVMYEEVLPKYATPRQQERGHDPKVCPVCVMSAKARASMLPKKRPGANA